MTLAVSSGVTARGASSSASKLKNAMLSGSVVVVVVSLLVSYLATGEGNELWFVVPFNQRSHSDLRDYKIKEVWESVGNKEMLIN